MQKTTRFLLASIVALGLGAAAHAQIASSFATGYLETDWNVDGDGTASTTQTLSGTAGNYLVVGFATEIINETTNPQFDLVQFNGVDMDLIAYQANGARKIGIYGIATTAGSGDLEVGISSLFMNTTNGGDQTYSYAFLDNVDTSGIAGSGLSSNGDGDLSFGSVSAGDYGFFVSAANDDTALTISPADTLTVLSQTDNASMGTYTGAFAEDLIAADAGTYDVTFGGGTATKAGVVLTAIPEPSTYALFAGVGGLALVLIRRRRRG
jgi:hypothetical protein